jgi:HEAT repeat protein
MEELKLDVLLQRIQSDDPDVRTAAWLAAGQVGPLALRPLAKIVAEGELEVSRAAKRAMWKIVRTVGAPDRGECKAAAETELVTLLADGQPDAVRREVFWMLSEIGGDKTIEAIREIPDILENKAIREDARCCVERIPGQAAVQALADGLEESKDEFQLALAQSLRARGVEVDKQKYPCQKLVPTKQTSVKPVAQ